MDIEKLDRYMARSAASYRSNGASYIEALLQCASCVKSRTSFFVDSLQTWHGAAKRRTAFHRGKMQRLHNVQLQCYTASSLNWK